MPFTYRNAHNADTVAFDTAQPDLIAAGNWTLISDSLDAAAVAAVAKLNAGRAPEAAAQALRDAAAADYSAGKAADVGRGVAGGVAALDSGGDVPAGELDNVGAVGLLKANNLSDLTSASTARTNLGLGGAATRAVGTATGTVAAGDDSRIVRALPVAAAALLSNRPATVVCSHRGGGSAQGGGYYQGPFPEETGEAFEASIAGGIAYLNAHACMLADGTVVLNHDTTPDRTTNATGAVAINNYTAPAFKKLKVTPSNVTLWPGYGVDWGEQHPLLLSEYLDRFGGRAAHVIECTKRGTQASGAVGSAVLAMLQARGLEKTAIVQSFAVAELTAAAAAGVETMYLPPDLGTAGSDATSIATAMASGWASGKPKHVGINAFPGGQTQSQVVTYVGTLVAAGFTVWAWTLCRRYDKAWLAAAGVTGFISDEPVYYNTAGAVNAGTVDPLSLGVWPHGFLPSDQSKGRGKLANGGAQLDYAGSSGAQLCCYGAFSPPANLTAYTVQADWVWDTLDSDSTRYPQVVVCCPDDRPASMIAGTGSGVVDGYQIIFRQSGAAVVVSKFNQGPQTQATLTTQSTGLPPAPSAGTVTTFKIQVTATQIITSLIQGGTTYGPWTVTDSTYRGGYFHLGKNVSSGTKLVGTWKNVSCA